MMVRKSKGSVWFRIAMAGMAAIVLAACGGGGGGSGGTDPQTKTPTAAHLVSIAVTPSDPFVARGFDRQLTATGTYSDGSTQDLTAKVNWSSSDDTHMTVTTGGVVSFVKANGSVSITATEATSGVHGSVAIAARPVAFLTSTRGDANLHNWPETVGLSVSGAAAADTICQTVASKAGLSGNFVAWVSDDTSDAYCRVHGLSGRTAANCGQASLPVDAGPWVRMDGYPFMSGLSELGSSTAPYTPIRFDEQGSPVSANEMVLTATDSSGALSLNTTCSNWSSGSNSTYVNIGLAGSTTNDWTGTGGQLCSSVGRLLCMQKGSGPALPSFRSTGKIVFITSVNGQGNLGAWVDVAGKGLTGIDAGDAICRARATAAKMANAANFKAWLSDSATNAIDRISSNGPWVRPDGVLVARDKATLATGQIFTSINQTEAGGFVSYAAGWTGTKLDGTKAANNCSDWTSNAGNPAGGATGFATDGYQISDGNSASWCVASASLYCIED